MSKKRKFDSLDDNFDDIDQDEIIPVVDEYSAKASKLNERIDQISEDLIANEKENVSLRKELQDTIEELKFLNETINISLDTMEDKERRIDEKISRSQVKDKIVLDVGGKVFATTKSTLLSIPNTYFHLMIESGNWHSDENGSYFIDRNYEHFHRILGYLRDGNVAHFEGLDDTSYTILKIELDFYQICPPKPLELDAYRSPSTAIFSNNNLSAKIDESTEPGIYGCVIGSKAVERYTIKIDGHEWLRVGFIQDESLFNEKISRNEFKNVPRYVISNYNGDLRGVKVGRSTSWDKESAKFVTGDYITCVKEGKNIRFEINKMDLGIAWFNVPNGPLFPFIFNGFGDPSFTLVHDY